MHLHLQEDGQCRQIRPAGHLLGRFDAQRPTGHPQKHLEEGLHMLHAWKGIESSAEPWSGSEARALGDHVGGALPSHLHRGLTAWLLFCIQRLDFSAHIVLRLLYHALRLLDEKLVPQRRWK